MNERQIENWHIIQQYFKIIIIYIRMNSKVARFDYFELEIYFGGRPSKYSLPSISYSSFYCDTTLICNICLVPIEDVRNNVGLPWCYRPSKDTVCIFFWMERISAQQYPLLVTLGNAAVRGDISAEVRDLSRWCMVAWRGVLLLAFWLKQMPGLLDPNPWLRRLMPMPTPP